MEHENGGSQAGLEKEKGLARETEARSWHRDQHGELPGILRLPQLPLRPYGRAQTNRRVWPQPQLRFLRPRQPLPGLSRKAPLVPAARSPLRHRHRHRAGHGRSPVRVRRCCVLAPVLRRPIGVTLSPCVSYRMGTPLPFLPASPVLGHGAPQLPRPPRAGAAPARSPGSAAPPRRAGSRRAAIFIHKGLPCAIRCTTLPSIFNPWARLSLHGNQSALFWEFAVVVARGSPVVSEAEDCGLPQD